MNLGRQIIIGYLSRFFSGPTASETELWSAVIDSWDH